MYPYEQKGKVPTSDPLFSQDQDVFTLDASGNILPSKINSIIWGWSGPTHWDHWCYYVDFGRGPYNGDWKYDFEIFSDINSATSARISHLKRQADDLERKAQSLRNEIIKLNASILTQISY